MIQRIQAMLSHLIRSETTEKEYYTTECLDIQSMMYRNPGWTFRTLRERGIASIKNTSELQYYNSYIKDKLPVVRPGFPWLGY